MTRSFLVILVFVLVACNPEGPTGPDPYSVVDVYGLWKIRAEDEGCAPGRVFNLQFGPLAMPITNDSVRVSGRWFLDQKNPEPRELDGTIHRPSGLAWFVLDIFHTKFIEGVFVSSESFSGAYFEKDGCVVRIKGRFLE
jgi:hypothetical protein